MYKPILLASAAALLFGGQAQAANLINTKSTFINSGNVTLGTSIGFNETVFKYSNNVQVGSIDSGLFGSYGARFRGGIGAELSYNGYFNASNTVSSSLIGSLSTVAGGQGKAGSAVVLYSKYSNISKTLGAGKGSIDTGFNAVAYAGAYANAKVCVVGCVGGNFFEPFGTPVGKEIFNYSSGTNSVTFLGKQYNNALPYTYQADNLPISATLNPVNFAGVASSDAKKVQYQSKQLVGGAYVDIAGVVAQSFGIPQEALSGSVFGFDYTTVAAKVGLAVEAAYTAYTKTTDQVIRYVFSQNMLVRNPNSGQFEYVGKGYTAKDGGVFEFKTADPTVTSVDVIPLARVSGTTTSVLALSASLQVNAKLLEVVGHGLDAGPLYEFNSGVNLGSIGTFATAQDFTTQSALKKFTITFDKPSGALSALRIAGLEGQDDDVFGEAGFVFVPDSSPVGDTVTGQIRLALNYRTRACNDDIIAGCRFDDEFESILQSRRTGRDPTGAPTITYGLDFEDYDAAVAMGEGTQGMQSSDEAVRSLLAALPGRGGYDLGPRIASNLTPFTHVPEPSAWLLMIGGLGVVGAAGRRTRRIGHRPGFNRGTAAR